MLGIIVVANEINSKITKGVYFIMKQINEVLSMLVFQIKFWSKKLFYWNGYKMKDKKSMKSRCKWSARISAKKNSFVRIGKVNIGSNSRLVAVGGGELEVDDNTFFNSNCIVVARNKIKIGENCAFGPNVCIYDHDHDFNKNGKIDGAYKLGNVVIGNNCWIGAGAIILRDTIIGDNCVLGAGAVVKGEIPENSLVKMDRVLNVQMLR